MMRVNEYELGIEIFRLSFRTFLLCTTVLFIGVTSSGKKFFAQEQVGGKGGASELPRELSNSFGMKMVLIPSGKFSMGSPSEEPNSRPEELLHKVAISKPFYMGSLEITEIQFAEVMEIQPREVQQKNSNGRVVGKRTIEFTQLPCHVTWFDAMRFCDKLSASAEEKKEGRRYRLPSEAEWEYACRATTQTAYHFGDAPGKLGDYAWYRGNSRNSQSKVFLGGQKKPNPWGLYDMYGNAQEWCLDLYRKDYPEGFTTDPCFKPNGQVLIMSMMVTRGGTSRSDVGNCRSASRNKSYADDRCGFRVVMVPTPEEFESSTMP